MDETIPGEIMTLNVIDKTRKAADFKSLPLSCKEVTLVILKCQMSVSLSKLLLTCYPIQVYSLKR